MPFSKTFPRTIEGSTYPRWEEIFLTEEEEINEEKKCKEENIRLMKECIDDAKNIVREKELKDFQSDVVNIAKVLFEKRASHEVYWKEKKAKERFDKMFNK